MVPLAASVRCLSASLLALLVPAAGAASLDPLAALNAVRRDGCAMDAQRSALAHAPQLDVAAQRVAAGQRLGEAIKAAGYRSVRAALISLDGVRNQDELRRTLAQSCTQLAAAGLRAAGTFANRQTIWIVLAEPFLLPDLEPSQVALGVLELVNAARAVPRRCGSREFGPSPPLARSARLERAAAAHARDMAARAKMDHAGRDGSTPGQRVSRAGYAWAAVGENVAAGQRDAQRVVASWLASAGHCANLMSAEYSEMGVAFATNPASGAGIYWAQVFAAPLDSGAPPALRR